MKRHDTLALAVGGLMAISAGLGAAALPATAAGPMDFLSNTLVCAKLLIEDPAAHARRCASGPPVPADNSLTNLGPAGSDPCPPDLRFDLTMLDIEKYRLPANLLASDVDTKCDEDIVDSYLGLPVYRFHYVGTDTAFYGLMIEDVLADGRFADAVVELPNGWRALDYEAIGLVVPDEAAMRAAGERAMAILGARRG